MRNTRLSKDKMQTLFIKSGRNGITSKPATKRKIKRPSDQASNLAINQATKQSTKLPTYKKYSSSHRMNAGPDLMTPFIKSGITNKRATRRSSDQAINQANNQAINQITMRSNKLQTYKKYSSSQRWNAGVDLKTPFIKTGRDGITKSERNSIGAGK